VRTQIPALAVPALLALQSDLPSQIPPSFRSGITTIPIYATVRASSGALVPDLTRDDFEIKDNGAKQEVTVFSRDPVPITVTLLIDVSGSQERAVMWMRDAGRAFVDAMLPGDRARIGTFGAEIAISPRLTADKTYLHRVLDEEIWPGGTTPLWEALDRAMAALADQPGRRVVLVLTDGVETTTTQVTPTALDPMGDAGLPDASTDTTRRTTSMLAPAERAVRRRPLSGPDPPRESSARIAREGFMIYAAARVPAPRQRPDGFFEVPSFIDALSLPMQHVALDSGGGYRVFGTTQDPNAAMRRVADELHHQYLLGFVPSVLDGQVHRLEVTTTRRGMSVQARRNYLAATP
jgi:VWFA-related protein